MNGPIAIDQNAIHNAMELYEIENRQQCFEKVLILSKHFISKMNQGGAS